MSKSPLQIIFELLVLIIQTTVDGLKLIFEKLVELFESLVFLANKGISGLIVASVIGGIVVILISRFIFGNTKTLLRVLLVYMGFVLVMILLFFLTTSKGQTPPVS